jgi:hypothetical protein
VKGRQPIRVFLPRTRAYRTFVLVAETLQDARACGARRRNVVTDQVQMKADVKKTLLEANQSKG